MKYFVISQPKAGTHLCAHLLHNLGIDFKGRQLSETNQYDYSEKNLDVGRANPGKVKIRKPFSKSVNDIEENEVAIGHIQYTSTIDNQLKDFKKVLILRDLKTTLESWKRWEKASGRRSNPGKHASKSFRSNIEKWKDKDDVFTLNFYDIKHKNVAKIDELQTFLFGEIKHDSLKAINDALNKKTLTKV